jgi:hypothetical protein
MQYVVTRAAVNVFVQAKSQPSKMERMMDGAAMVTPVESARGIKKSKLVKTRVLASKRVSKN